MKKEMTSVDIAAAVQELKSLEGSKFEKIYQYPQKKLRFKLRDIEKGRVDLIIQVGEIKRIHLVENPEEAPKRPPNLPMLMRKRLSGGNLTSVDQYGFDRVVLLKGKRDKEYVSVAELFGDGNFAFLDSENTVLSCFNTVRLDSRTVVDGEKYEFPSSHINPFELSFDKFVSIMEDSDTDIVRTVASQLSFGGIYAEELCLKAGLKKEKDIQETSERDYELLFEAINDLQNSLNDLSPRIVYNNGDLVDVLPIKLKKYEGYDFENFDNFNKALESYFEQLSQKNQIEEKDQTQKEIEKKKGIIKQQERALEDFKEEEESFKEKAELLYTNYNKVDEILKFVKQARESNLSWEEIEKKLQKGKEKNLKAAKLFDSFENGYLYIRLGEKKIKLDINIGVEKNANNLYKKSKEIKQKREGAIEAMEEKKKELKELKNRKKTTSDVQNNSNKKIKPRSSKWFHRFRWFHTSDDFLVIGGRNADQNDEIYKKYVEKNDLFFHTEAKGGPITILKTSEPEEPNKDIEVPEKSKKEAAIFAGSYSNLWKQGRHAAEVYSATPDQISKTPESGEYIEKGAVVVRGKRNYYKIPLRIALGLKLKGEAGVIGGPTPAIEEKSKYTIRLEPGRYKKADIAKKIYRKFSKLEDITKELVNVDQIQKFLPPGGSRIVD